MRQNSTRSISDTRSRPAALGFIELTSSADAVVCADAALKAASVIMLPREINDGSVIVKFRGDVADVACAVEVGRAAVMANSGARVVAALVIPGPHEMTDKLVSPGYETGGAPELEGKKKTALPDNTISYSHNRENTEKKLKKKGQCNFFCSLCKRENCPARKVYH